jgi:hypothetical protein
MEGVAPNNGTPKPDSSKDGSTSFRQERDAACREIVRLLKPGGAAIISDFRHTGEYAKVFQAAGLTVRRSYHPWDTFPPLTIVEAQKPKLD